MPGQKNDDFLTFVILVIDRYEEFLPIQTYKTLGGSRTGAKQSEISLTSGKS